MYMYIYYRNRQNSKHLDNVKINVIDVYEYHHYIEANEDINEHNLSYMNRNIHDQSDT